GSGSYGGYYPHPFALQKTTYSRGGPPGKGDAGVNTVAGISPYLLLQSQFTALQKYEAATGNLSWVATSGFDIVASGTTSVTTSGTGLGGVGWGVRVESHGEVYSIGPKQSALIGNEAITTDGRDIRKFGDTGTAFTYLAGAEGDPWSAPLMALDSLEST